MVVSQKSPGVAVLLSFLWLGAGNLYVNQIPGGVALLLANMFLIMLAATIFGLLIAVPMWFVLFIISAVTASSAATQHNARYGLL